MRRNKRNPTALQNLTVLVISVLFVMTALIGLFRCFSREPTTGTDADTLALPSMEEENPDGLEPVDAENQAIVISGRKPHFHTILVGGLDDENGGSDTNLLVALDAENGSIQVVSLPRDTLLNVSWSVKKLNSAYHHGGFTQTMTEVSKLLGIPVDHYVTVDLQAFEELVDAVQGVDFDIPVDMDYDDPAQDLYIHFPAGPRHLNGEDALKVVRWRKNNDGTGYATADIGRIGTQQAFLTAVAKQTLRVENLDKIPAFAEIFQKWVDTDLSLSNLVWLGQQALTIGSEGVSFYTLPGDGAGYYKGTSYYVLDAGATRDLINAHFNPYQQDLTLEDMDILVP